MEQKRELSLTPSAELSKETKSQQVVNFWIRDKLVEIYGSQIEDMELQILSDVTELELNKAHNNVALTCTGYFRLFKPNFKSELVYKLLVCVAWGKQDEVEKLLKTSPELMLEKTTFTDCSGRIFSNISPFEFVLWALDTRYMVNMMLNCFPKDENGSHLAEQLEEQYNNHKKYGVTYTLKGQTINEKHFDFLVLINALQVYADNCDNWDLPQRQTHWCTVVGKAQCYVPAHVMQHYCDPRLDLYPLPKFEAKHFYRTLKFFNYVCQAEVNWSPLDLSSGCVLGEDFGISHGWDGGRSVRGGRNPESRYAVMGDLAAIKALYEARTSDYLAVPSKLASFFEKRTTEEGLPGSYLIP